MIWKILLTAAVILGGFAFVMARLRGADRPRATVPLLHAGRSRRIAYAVLGLMLAGFGWSRYAAWKAGNEVMAVQVVNANTGAITRYEARHRSIEGRGFRTLDGREVRLADVERMILEPAASRRLPTAGARAPGDATGP